MADDKPQSFMERFLQQSPEQPSTRIGVPSLVVNRDASTPYMAFDAKDKLIRLHVRCAHPPIAYTFPYAYLVHFDYNYQTWDEFSLTVGSQTITVRGRNLHPVVDAISMHRCEWIEEYDPTRFAAPPADVPVIEQILVEIVGGKTE